MLNFCLFWYTVKIIKNGSFDSAETKIIVISLWSKFWESVIIYITLFCEIINLLTTGITKTKQFTNFIKSLTTSIISRSAECFINTKLFYMYKLGMSTRNEKRYKWRLYILVFHGSSPYMRLKVIDTYAGDTKTDGKCLSKTQSHKK